jgi:hypothetical protein
MRITILKYVDAINNRICILFIYNINSPQPEDRERLITTRPWVGLHGKGKLGSAAMAMKVSPPYVSMTSSSKANLYIWLIFFSI